MDLYMTPLIRIANKCGIRAFDLNLAVAELEHCTAWCLLLEVSGSQLCTQDGHGQTMLKIFGEGGVDFTAEDLLSLSVPFGYVISVQKIVKYGHLYGLVSYSNFDDAAMAMMKLNGTTNFIVNLVLPREDKEVHKTERSATDRPRHLFPDRFNDRHLQRIPRLMNTECSPTYSQGVLLHIRNLPRHFNQKRWVFSFLPPSTSIVKVQRRRALVAVPDISNALWLMDYLNELYIDSRPLRVSFAKQGDGGWPARRTACQRSHRQHLFMH